MTTWYTEPQGGAFTQTYFDPSAQIANLADAVKALRKSTGRKYEADNWRVDREVIDLLDAMKRIREANWPTPANPNEVTA